MREPKIKASFFQGSVDALAVLDAKRALAEAALRDEIDATRRASRADWLPMAFDFKLTDVVHELGGREAVIALNKRSFFAATEGPLIRPVVQSAFRLFGVTPRVVVKTVRSAWEAGTKDCGQMVAEFLEEDVATVTITGVVAGPRWFDGIVGLLEGIFELTDHEGTIDVEHTGDGAIYRLRWQRRREQPR